MDWPDAVVNQQEISRSERDLRLVVGFSDYSVLPDLSNLRAFWCFGIDEKKWARISNCSGLRRLFIEGLKVRDLSRVHNLTNLEVLGLEDCSLIVDLDEIGKLYRLKGLAIANFKNVHSLKPLANMVELRHLAVTGGMWTRMKVDSLDPLSSLTKLEWMDLGNTKVVDDSLQALGNLTQLEYLNLPNFFPMEEFAWLSGRLPRTKCTWFEPFIDLPFMVCKKCGSFEVVMLAGKRKPNLCKRCDATRLQKHAEEFHRIASRSKLAE